MAELCANSATGTILSVAEESTRARDPEPRTSNAPPIQQKSNGKATGRAEMLPCTDGQYDFAKANVMARLDAYPFV